jgi:DNA-binding HxlR family transcriptional regulator
LINKIVAIVTNELNFDLHPVVRALKILGDKWIILILKNAFLGYNRFNQLKENTGASKGTLTSRLEFLIQHNMIRKHAYSQKPLRYEYRLTSKTIGLYPWALAVWKWEVQWAANRSSIPSKLIHNAGGKHELQPFVICKQCKQPLHLHDIEREYNHLNANNSDRNEESKSNFRSSAVGQESQSLDSIVDIIGDRWNPMILACCNFGYKRYDEFHLQLGIATNILSDRIKKLTDCGLLSKSLYQDAPKRYEYLLTEKGISLHQHTMVMRHWALDTLTPQPSPFIIKHKLCGHDLAVEVVCAWCKEAPLPHEVDAIY